jgi:hypothetical protein
MTTQAGSLSIDDDPDSAALVSVAKAMEKIPATYSGVPAELFAEANKIIKTWRRDAGPLVQTRRLAALVSYYRASARWFPTHVTREREAREALAANKVSISLD